MVTLFGFFALGSFFFVFTFFKETKGLTDKQKKELYISHAEDADSSLNSKNEVAMTQIVVKSDEKSKS